MSPRRARRTPRRRRSKRRAFSLSALQRKNARILRDHLDRQLKEGAEFLDATLSHLVGGTLGAVLNPLVGILYRYAARDAIQKRARRQLDLLIACAARAAHRPLPEAVEELLPDYYPTEEAWVRANHNHPKFPEVEGLLRRAFEARVEGVLRLLQAEGTTYRELSRQAYPSRKEAQRAAQGQFEVAQQLLDLLEGESNIVRLPGLLRGPIFRILREALQWTRGSVERELDAIYASPVKGT